MWTLGKTAALAASVRIATRQQGRARLLQARIDLAREIHERVVQRLFGVSLVLGSERGAERGGAPALRRRDAGGAHDLRDALGRPLAPPEPRHRRDAARGARAARAAIQDLPLELELGGGRRGARGGRAAGPVGARRGAAQRRQARASRPACGCGWAAPTARSCSRCATTAPASGTRGAGMGLRLAAFEALQRGALVEFGPRGRRSGACGWWCRSRTSRRMSPERNLRVLVVDDHDVVHWGFRLLLTEQPWVERCLSASNAEEALELARRYEPHVALVDLFLGEESGAELCEAIRRESPAHARAADLRRRLDLAEAARAAGASGFVSKDWSAARHRQAVRMVGKGMTVFAPRAEQPAAPLVRPRARGARADRHGRDQPGDRGAAVPLPAHGQGAHRARSTASSSVRNRAEAVQRAQRLGLTG